MRAILGLVREAISLMVWERMPGGEFANFSLERGCARCGTSDIELGTQSITRDQEAETGRLGQIPLVRLVKNSGG